MTLSTTLVNDILNQRFRSTACYLSLHTSSPISGGLATGELTTANYRRLVVPWRPAENRTITNATDLTFSGLPMATIGYLGIYDALVGGKLLAELVAEPPYRTGTTGSTLYLPQDTLVVELL